MKLSIVVHVYSEELEVYARLWTAQLSSLILAPPQNCEVEFQCWTTPTDKLTAYVAEQFQHKYQQHGVSASIRLRMLDKKSLFRRAVGRNISAKECEADVMHFSDCDYGFFSGCLDAIASTDFESHDPAEMVFPRMYFMQESHEIGDAEIARIVPGEIFETDRRNYFKKILKLGIGGLQIVEKKIARRGYLEGSKWCQPRPDERAFPDTNDDSRYRRTIHSSVPISVPNLFRARHGSCSYESTELRAVRMGKKHLLG